MLGCAANAACTHTSLQAEMHPECISFISARVLGGHPQVALLAQGILGGKLATEVVQVRVVRVVCAACWCVLCVCLSAVQATL